jgi:hypothetical protein
MGRIGCLSSALWLHPGQQVWQHRMAAQMVLLKLGIRRDQSSELRASLVGPSERCILYTTFEKSA